jgi:membrane associated rhomboid family serine protease
MPFTFSITVFIIIITAIVSIFAFSSQKAMDDLIFFPAAISENRQYYRFITYGFIHADWMHLIFNMYAFYLFGQFTEDAFNQLFGDSRGPVLYIAFYILALIVSIYPDFLRYRHNYQYRSLGASGAVSAIVFAYILLNPVGGIGLIFIPVFVPGFLFGILFLVISYFLAKKGRSRVNHFAHIWGAIFGLVFLIILSKLFSDYPTLEYFIMHIKEMSLKDLIQTY